MDYNQDYDPSFDDNTPPMPDYLTDPSNQPPPDYYFDNADYDTNNQITPTLYFVDKLFTKEGEYDIHSNGNQLFYKDTTSVNGDNALYVEVPDDWRVQYAVQLNYIDGVNLFKQKNLLENQSNLLINSFNQEKMDVVSLGEIDGISNITAFKSKKSDHYVGVQYQLPNGDYQLLPNSFVHKNYEQIQTQIQQHALPEHSAIVVSFEDNHIKQLWDKMDISFKNDDMLHYLTSVQDKFKEHPQLDTLGKLAVMYDEANHHSSIKGIVKQSLTEFAFINDGDEKISVLDYLKKDDDERIFGSLKEKGYWVDKDYKDIIKPLENNPFAMASAYHILDKVADDVLNSSLPDVNNKKEMIAFLKEKNSYIFDYLNPDDYVNNFNQMEQSLNDLPVSAVNRPLRDFIEHYHRNFENDDQITNVVRFLQNAHHQLSINQDTRPIGVALGLSQTLDNDDTLNPHQRTAINNYINQMQLGSAITHKGVDGVVKPYYGIDFDDNNEPVVQTTPPNDFKDNATALVEYHKDDILTSANIELDDFEQLTKDANAVVKLSALAKIKELHDNNNLQLLKNNELAQNATDINEYNAIVERGILSPKDMLLKLQDHNGLDSLNYEVIKANNIKPATLDNDNNSTVIDGDYKDKNSQKQDRPKKTKPVYDKDGNIIGYTEEDEPAPAMVGGGGKSFSINRNVNKTTTTNEAVKKQNLDSNYQLAPSDPFSDLANKSNDIGNLLDDPSINDTKKSLLLKDTLKDYHQLLQDIDNKRIKPDKEQLDKINQGMDKIKDKLDLMRSNGKSLPDMNTITDDIQKVSERMKKVAEQVSSLLQSLGSIFKK